MRLLVLLSLIVFPGFLLAQEGRTKTRLLYSFENDTEVPDLKRLSEEVDLIVVQDNGVTEGKNCCRVTAPKGVGYSVFQLGVKAAKEWKDFDYFAMDVYSDDEQGYDINFELWDALSKNYATRFTQSLKTRKGKQTLLFPINRARRNGKEGREWSELEPKDKIDLNGLTRVKIFLTPLKDRDAVLWIDNLRLLQEDAAKPKMRVALPTGAIAFDFGTPGAVVPGFHNVAATTTWNEKTGFGFSAGMGRTHAGEGWPDLLTGTYVAAPPTSRMVFKARVPDGEYLVWLAAGKVIRHDLQAPHFYLALNEQTQCDEKPTVEELQGTKYLYRFLDTQYSEKPHALWHHYIRRMYPATTHRVKVTKGLLTLETQNHFLGGLILVPVSQQSDFEGMTTAIEETRIKAFEQTYYAPPKARPKLGPKDGSLVTYVPHPLRTILPWSGPSTEERERALDVSAARGQFVVARLALTPFADAKDARVVVSDFRGDKDATISAKHVQVLLQQYRGDGKGVSEMCLLPTTKVPLEQGVTRCVWFRLHVPEEATPGVYSGSVRLFVDAADGKSTFETQVPCKLTVYPFKLRSDIPLSLGMYFHEPNMPVVPSEKRREVLKDLLSWMREIGFTGVAVPAPSVTGLKNDGKVTLKFEPLLYELAREVGMGARPEQYSMGSVLGLGRAIGRRLPGSQGATVDQQPGIELRQPKHKEYFLDAVAQYRDFNEKMKLPVAVEIVDEPREVPNPWNRNLADTLTYADYVNAVPRLKGFVTPMSDGNGGKDYTVLADHVSIVSVHAWKASAGLMKRTREKNRTLWLYNTGMDRFSWGFYNWRVGSAGRWEWHFCWPEDQAVGGYPGREWYNPFTSLHGLAPQAPWSQYRGGILHNSAFLEVAEGINDARYLFTLEETLKECKKAGKHEKTVAEAEALLGEIRKAIPEYPSLHGLSGEGDGALIGQGIKDSAAVKAGEWRAKIAALLTIMTR